MTASRAHGRRAGLAALLALVGAVLACAAPPPPAPSSRAELLRRFESGEVRLDCDRCRFDFRAAEWLLDQGEYETLVVEILASGDGSGRSWYLLGRVAEATGRRELALHYYQEALATQRNPILALWPLYEDLRYRVRRLVTKPTPAAPEPRRAVAARPPEPERVTADSLVVVTRPGTLGAFVEKLYRGDGVEVLDRSGDWEQVRLADGRVGWVWAAHTSAPGSGAAAERATERRAGSRRTARAAAARTPARAPKAARPPAAKPAPKAVVRKAATPEPPPLIAAPEPAATVAEPGATIAAPEPAATIAAPEPAATVAAPEPGATVAAPEPGATVAAPEPGAKPGDGEAPADEPAAPTLAASRPARTTTSRALAEIIAALPASEPPPPPASSLATSGDAGILGCPLPQGAALSGRSHGSAGTDDHPTETYAIEAPAQEIVGFYEREMERAGWRKSFAASEFLLYFEKDDQTIGVLIERKGGVFTLMGS